MAKKNYAELIAKLLAKAESTNHPEEADTFLAKAQELMTQYAISEAMVDAARGASKDEIEQRDLKFVGLFYETKSGTGWAALRANGCKGVYYDVKSWMREIVIDGKQYREGQILTVTGFRSDLDRVEALNASLQVQLSSALSNWYRENKRDWWSKGDDHRERKEFIRGFCNAVAIKLETARKAGQEEATREHAKETGVTEQEASDSVALVLRSREDRVSDWYDKKYGNSLRTSRRRYTRGSSSASEAGRSAGARADIGQPGVSGNRGELGR